MANSSSSKQHLQEIYQLIKQNNHAEARQLLQRYLKANPSDADAYFIATFLTDDVNRKIQMCQRALQFNPKHSAALQLLAKLQAGSKPSQTTSSPSLNVRDARPRSTSSGNGASLVLGILISLIVVAIIGVLVISRFNNQTNLPSAAQVSTSTASPVPASSTPITKVAPNLPTLAPLPTLTRAATRTRVPTLDPLFDTGETATPNRAVNGATLTPTLLFGARELDNPVRNIPYLIQDAEYSTSLDKIIFIAVDPNMLYIYDPESQAKQTVNLERKPTALSVSRDGKFAVVAHDALVTYIDLQTATIIKTLTLSTTTSDIVLLDTGWVVILSQRDQLRPFHLLNVEDNTETTPDMVPSYYDGYLMRHQDGLSVYYGTRGVYPESMTRYFFDKAGQLAEERKWPYYGEHEFCGRLWASADGKQLVGRCGTVFHSSTSARQDMTYAGSLPDVMTIDSVVNANSLHMFLTLGYPLIGQRYDTEKFIPPYPMMVSMYDQTTLSRTGLVALPLMASGYKATSGYLFLNAAQSRYYVLLKRNGRVHPNGAIEAMNEIEFGLVVGRTDGSLEQVLALSTEVSTEVMVPSATMTLTEATTPLPTPPTLVAPDVIGDIQRLDYRVQQAEYSKTLNRIVMISDNPPALHVYDPVKGTQQTVSLSQPPSALSVSPDGKFAAVGHKGLITYVDLQAAKVIKTLEVAFEVSKILLAGNGWVYASGQDENQFNAKVGIEIATGRQGQGFEGIAKMHPNGDVYAQTSHEIKIDHVVLTDPANPQIILNSRYVDFCGKFWITEDGNRIVTRCSTVLRASLDAKLDRTDNGKLDLMGDLNGFDYSQLSGKAVAVGSSQFFTGDYSEQLVIYSYDTLSADKFIAMPTMTIDGTALKTRGNYVFFDADGFDYYIVLQNATNSPDEVVYQGVAHLRIEDTSSILTGTPTVVQTAVPTANDLDRLDFAVTNAAYSKPLDRIIMTTISPNRLVIYNPADRSKITVELANTANSLRLSPDGLSAVIGHDGLISLIDLRMAKVQKTYEMPVAIFDAVLAPNGFIYATPKHVPTFESSVKDIYSIKLSTSKLQEYDDSSIGAQNAVLHIGPDGSYLYYALAEDGAPPIRRIPIAKNGTLSKPVQWTDHTDEATCRSVWFTADNSRLLTACGRVIKISANPDEDVTYTGMLSQSIYPVDPLPYLWMTDSTTADVILAFPDLSILETYNINKDVAQQILIYNSSTLQFMSAIELPLMITPQKQAHTIGQYAFINAAGDHYYVILKAEPNASFLNEYAIWSSPLSK